MKAYRLKPAAYWAAASSRPQLAGLRQQEFDWLTRLGPAVDRHRAELTTFEQRFAEDFLERFRQWGVKTKISPKQWEIIAGISEKIL